MNQVRNTRRHPSAKALPVKGLEKQGCPAEQSVKSAGGRVECIAAKDIKPDFEFAIKRRARHGV